MLIAATTEVVCAADQPLRVYAYGAPGASVYVAPVSAMAPTGDADMSYRVFWKRYLRGHVPLETNLKPGRYLVCVVRTAELNMRDASLRAHELFWDGYDYHALVGQPRETWRYAQCYLIDKQADWPAEVLAVFTDHAPTDEALSFDCGPKAARYTGEEDAAAEALTAQHIPMTFHEDILQGLRAGHKVLLQIGESRYAIQCDGPANVRVTTARGWGAWAGHRLSIVPVE